ncbi:hypothetical protein TNCV_2864231 [Trichonephila clavipes]|nr:hypothetical protein TNCV_2864231 [Trichonephila clavipes]
MLRRCVFLLARRCAVLAMLQSVEGNQTKPCFVDEAPVGEPGVFPVGDEMGAGWGQGHTVHRLSLRGGGQQLRGLHILEVLVERAKHSSPVRAAAQVARTVAICGCPPDPVSDSPGQLAHCLKANLLVPGDVVVCCVGREGEDILDFTPRSRVHLFPIQLAELGRPHGERQGGEEGLDRINLLPLCELRGGQLL